MIAANREAEDTGIWLPPSYEDKSVLDHRSSPYRAGHIGKMDSEWVPGHWSGDQAIREAMDLVTARIRDLARNDPIINKIQTELLTQVIASGLKSFSTAMEPSGEQFFDEFALENDDRFERWALEEADAERAVTHWDHQRLSFKELMTIGNSLFLEVMDADPSRTIPLSYQLLEWEQLDQSVDFDANSQSAARRRKAGRPANRISYGREYDSKNRVIAYYLFDTHPGSAPASTFPGVQYGASRRIPANRVIHNYIKDRPSSFTGISWLAHLVVTALHRNRLLQNELTTSSLRALMALIVKRDQPTGDLGQKMNARDEHGRKRVQLGYPAIAEIGVNDSAEIVQSAAGAESFDTLLSTIYKSMAMGAGISIPALTGDPGDAVFASIKWAQRRDELHAAPIRQHQSLHVALKMRKRHNEMAAAMGRYRTVTPEQFVQERWNLQQFTVLESGDPDLQAKDEVEATIMRLGGGLEDIEEANAKRGHHWRKTILKNSRAFEVARKYGVKLDWSKGQGGIHPASTSDAFAIEEVMEKQQQQQQERVNAVTVA